MNRCLYLVSSSASREYIVDCLEALALPRGMIQHFRYRIRYIDKRLQEVLPKASGELPASLRDSTVMVVYLYQDQKVGVWRPGETMGAGGPYVPIRYGRLIHAFLDGEIAHFFFELTGYVKPMRRRASARVLLNTMIKFRTTIGKKAPVSYAHIGADIGLLAPQIGDTDAFQKFVDDSYQSSEWRTRSLGSAPLDVTYDIVFFRVAGVFRERGNSLVPLSPVQKSLQGSVFCEYELKTGTTYHIKLATHLSARLPAELPGRGNARLTLRFDPSVIRSVGPTSLRVSSLYDLEYWSIMPDCSRNQRTVLTIICEHDVSIDHENFVRRELLCPEISLPVSVVSSGSNNHGDSVVAS